MEKVIYKRINGSVLTPFKDLMTNRIDFRTFYDISIKAKTWVYVDTGLLLVLPLDSYGLVVSHVRLHDFDLEVQTQMLESESKDTVQLKLYNHGSRTILLKRGQLLAKCAIIKSLSSLRLKEESPQPVPGFNDSDDDGDKEDEGGIEIVEEKKKELAEVVTKNIQEWKLTVPAVDGTDGEQVKTVEGAGDLTDGFFSTFKNLTASKGQYLKLFFYHCQVCKKFCYDTVKPTLPRGQDCYVCRDCLSAI